MLFLLFLPQMEVEPLILILEAVPLLGVERFPSAFSPLSRAHTRTQRTFTPRMPVNVFWQLGRPLIFLIVFNLVLMMMSKTCQLNALEAHLWRPPRKAGRLGWFPLMRDWQNSTPRIGNASFLDSIFLLLGKNSWRCCRGTLVLLQIYQIWRCL